MYMMILIYLLLPFFCNAYPQWFENYIQEHNKSYVNIEEAYNILRPKYESILDTVDLELKLHHFSDTHMQKNKQIRRRLKTDSKNVHTRHHLGTPASFSWKDKGFVTDVVRQGSCGGCFAIAAMGSLEYWYKKKSNKLLKMSIQQGLDCTRPVSDGCDGGLMEDVYDMAMTHAIGPESWDSYKQHNSICKHRRSKPWLKVKSYMVMSDEYMTHQTIESKMAHNLLSYGPIPIGIDSSSHAFELYSSGIIKSHHCGKDIDHAVVIVGYTPEYWIVKNSWGKEWGEDGYFRIERNKNACGLATYASFVTDASV